MRAAEHKDRVPCGFGAVELATLRNAMLGLEGVPPWVARMPDWRFLPSSVAYVDVPVRKPRTIVRLDGDENPDDWEIERVALDKRFPTKGRVPYVDEVRMGWSERAELVVFTAHIRP